MGSFNICHAQCLPGGPKGPLFSSNTVSWRYGGGRVPFRRRHIPYNPHRYHNPWWHFCNYYINSNENILYKKPIRWITFQQLLVWYTNDNSFFEQ